MVEIVSVVSWTLSALSLGPALVLAVQCGVASLPRLRKPNSEGRPAESSASTMGSRPSIGVLIPAHNEEAVIGDTLRSVLPQLAESDRVLVVADNCDDATAEIASREGAQVLVRNNEKLRGKGWALAAGRDAFKELPPSVLVIVDADTQVGESFFDLLALRVRATGAPVQATYVMPADKQAGLAGLLSSFAWLVRNYVRPLGLHRLGLPCLLNGSGMAFPWRVIENAPLAGGHVGEEYKLAVDLTLSGAAPRFCPAAVVAGSMPVDQQIAVAQRKRWSHSHLQILQQCVPQLLVSFIKRPSLAPLCLALDLAVPPLTMMIAAQLGVTALTAAAVMVGADSLPFVVSALSLGVATLAIAVSWIRFGQKERTRTAVLALPAYMYQHGPHYFSFFRKKHTEWTKTPRESAAEETGTIS